MNWIFWIGVLYSDCICDKWAELYIYYKQYNKIMILFKISEFFNPSPIYLCIFFYLIIYFFQFSSWTPVEQLHISNSQNKNSL